MRWYFFLCKYIKRYLLIVLLNNRGREIVLKGINNFIVCMYVYFLFIK